MSSTKSLSTLACAVALIALALPLLAQTSAPATQPTTAPTSQPATRPASVAKSAATRPVDAPESQFSTRRQAMDVGPAEKTFSAIPWLEAVKKPVPWVTLGGDERMREHYTNNITYLDEGRPAHDQHFQRYRTRLWTTVTPIENIEFNMRLTWEFYNYCEPATASDSKRDTNLDEVVYDNLNVKWKKTFGLDNTLTVGRQDILDLGTGWLVQEGTPLDGSRTFYFDAIRDTYEIKEAKTTADLIYIHTSAYENDWLRPMNTQDKYITEQDENGVIAWVKNKSIEKTQLDGYFIYKHDNQELSNGDTGEIYTIGGRVEHDFDEHWKGRAEYAEQFGHKNGEELSARGLLSRLTYKFNDRFDNEAHVGYEYLSGDDNPNKDFDPLWGRWPQWSELIPYTYAPETRMGYITNLHRLNVGWSAKPTKIIELLADYNLLFAADCYDNKPGFSDSDHFRGQLVSAVMRYKFNEYVSGHLLGEVFFPGGFYDHESTAVFIRYQLVFTW